MVYAAVAVIGAAVAIQCRRGALPYSERVWWWLAGGLVVLGAIRQWQLLTWLTDLIRQTALQDGWYMERRAVQRITVVAAAAVGLALFGALHRRLRHLAAGDILAVYLYLGLVALALLQIISLHQIDSVLNLSIAGTRLGRLLEIALAACLSLTAWLGWLGSARGGNRSAHISGSKRL